MLLGARPDRRRVAALVEPADQRGPARDQRRVDQLGGAVVAGVGLDDEQPGLDQPVEQSLAVIGGARQLAELAQADHGAGAHGG